MGATPQWLFSAIPPSFALTAYERILRAHVYETRCLISRLPKEFFETGRTYESQAAILIPKGAHVCGSEAAG